MMMSESFMSGLTEEVNRPGVAGSGLNERLGRRADSWLPRRVNYGLEEKANGGVAFED
jgi:hypothetical protein